MAAGSGAAAVAADCAAARAAAEGMGVMVVVAERAVAQMVREKLVALAQSTSLLMSSATR